MPWLDFIGWVGQILLALCVVPQTLYTLRTGHATGITWAFLMMWYLGEIFSFAYVWPMAKLPLTLNYGVNIICLTVMVWYKFRPRKRKE